MDPLHPPLSDLGKALKEIEPYLETANEARGADYVNHEGGDVGGHSTQRSLFRHVANYLAAAELGHRAGVSDAVLDVGSGTGGLAAWVADRLAAQLHLVDRDPAVRAVALRAFPSARVHAELDEVGVQTVGLVTAMEVIEHVTHAAQLAFVCDLLERVEARGLLVVSTPDESRYLGRWSGYEPHVGPLDARDLQALLSDAVSRVRRQPGARVRVWRLEGDAFHLGPVRRVLQPLANRAWTAAGPLLAPVARHLAGPAAALADLARTHAGPDLESTVTAVPPGEGRGSGLLGVVQVA